MTMFLRQSTASQEILLGPFVDSTDGVTPENALTIANTDIQIFKDGATTLANKNSGGATYITSSNGFYSAVLDATDTDTLGKIEINVYVSGALPVRREFTVVSANVYDSLVAASDSLTVDVVEWLGTACATPTVAGVPETDITHIAGAAVNTTSAQLGVNVVNVAGAAEDLARETNHRTTIATLASQTSFTLTAGSADDDAYNGWAALVIDSVTSTQRALAIASDYVGSTKTLTLESDPAIFTMAVGDTIILIPATLTAAVDANVIQWAGTNVATPTVAGVPEVDITHVGGSAQDISTATALTSVANDVTAVLADTNELQTDWANGGRLDVIVDAILDDTGTSGVVVATNNDKTGYSISGTKTTLDALNDVTAGAVADAVWDESTTGHTTAGTFGEQVKTDIDAILVDTNSLNDTKIPDTISLAAINAEADTAITDAALATAANLATVDTVVDAIKVVTDALPNAGALTDITTHLTDIKGATFNGSTDSLEAIRDRGDAAWTTGAGGTPPQLLQSTTIATLSTQTSFTLTAGSADDDAYNNAIAVITDAVTSEQKAFVSISDYVGSTKTITLSASPVFTIAVSDTIEIIAALGSAGAAPTVEQIRTEMDTNSTQLAAIVADTNELQTDWADGGRLDVILDARASQSSVDTVDGIVDAILDDTGTSGVVVATNNDKTGYSISGTKTTLDALNDVSVAAVADGVWDEPTTGHITAGTFGEQVKTDIDAILVDTNSLDGTKIPDTISLAAINAEADTAISDAALATAASLSSVASDVTAVLADTNELQTDLADGGRLDLLIDAIKAVTDALPNGGALENISAADVNAQVLDVLNTDTFAELSAVPSAAATITQMVRWLYLLSRNKQTQTATTFTLRNDADSADIATATVSDDATTFTKGKAV